MVDGLQVCLCILRVVEVCESEVSLDVVFLDEFPHERLGGLDPGCGLSGCGAFHALFLEGIHDTHFQGGLGTDVCQFHSILPGEGADLLHVLLVAEEMFHGPLQDTGVGVLHHGIDLRTGTVQGLHGRMLPSSSTDSEYLHIDAP